VSDSVIYLHKIISSCDKKHHLELHSTFYEQGKWEMIKERRVWYCGEL